MNRRALLLGLAATPFAPKAAEAEPAWNGNLVNAWDDAASPWVGLAHVQSDPRVEWSDDGVNWTPVAHTIRGSTIVIDNARAARFWQVTTMPVALSTIRLTIPK